MDTSSGLLTDLYELTMAAAYVAEAMAEKPATFSLFVRDLPPARGYLVAAGLDAVLEYLETLRFTGEDVDYLGGLGLFGPEVLDRLAGLRFTGSVRAMPEGTVAFAGEPLLEVTGPVVEAQLVETFVLNQVTTETTLASKAARYRHAARGRPLVDFAFRRAQGLDSAMKLVRAVAICGLAGTSNVAGGRRHGVRVSGTMAHSFVQAHADETAAFRAFAQLFGAQTVLLVDTYDTARGVERAIGVARALREAGRPEPRGIRLDSGDLADLARLARRRLDEEGFPDMRILASGGLDEHLIEDMVAEGGAPIDGFGVGSDMGVSADAPVLDSVYKLVEFDGRLVRKLSSGKQTWPGAKQVWRRDGWSGDVLALAGEPAPGPDATPLLVEVMRDGARTEAGRATLADAHDRFEQQWAGLPEAVKRLRDPAGSEVEISSGLDRAAREWDQDG
ncbi:MAG: nicotinate phosphoribosyltransferase [Acidimicrobiales bacterium]